MRCVWACVAVLIVNLVPEITDGLSLPAPPTSRTCIIGAGYSGLAAARYLKDYDLSFVVFEATKHVGGTWHYDPHVGFDEEGLPVYTSMYKYLRTNTPIQTMEYTGFPFPDGTPSYPTATCFHKYLKLFAKSFDLVKRIQFKTFVTSVEWAAGRWIVSYTKLDSKENATESCDYVIVANGEFLNPYVPKFQGLDLFKGSIIHSHYYREPEKYQGRRVLIVGAGPSGLDLAMHLSNFTKKLVHSHHLKYNQPNFGPNYKKKPDIITFTSDGVVFEDNSFEELDNVILCTGYEFDHPFLDKSCGITKSGKYVLPLYQHVVNIMHPSMMFIGVSKKVINRVFDAQAQYVAALIAKKFELPSQEEMLKKWVQHAQSLPTKRMKLVDINVIGDQQDQYFGNLTKEASIPRVPPVLTEIRDFNAKIRLEDLLNYRDYDYKLLNDYKYERWYNYREDDPCPIEI
ncbi:senecionine N-oxygenase-like [Hyposmocoma kahamanoa]|uniref:senecionine N-oxygenase-like n=1 Tax=Hyposmocoma kahamanoa TaxID=1477025 RepID=UPI000E6D83E3|nr:senecionine N-oxygenase-like [Hyposmocoma kahamanoa]